MAFSCPTCFRTAGAGIRRVGVAGQGPSAGSIIPCPEDTDSDRCHFCPGFRRSVFCLSPRLAELTRLGSENQRYSYPDSLTSSASFLLTGSSMFAMAPESTTSSNCMVPDISVLSTIIRSGGRSVAKGAEIITSGSSGKRFLSCYFSGSFLWVISTMVSKRTTRLSTVTT